MANPFTKTDLESMELVFEGKPYTGDSNSSINLASMEWVFEGKPFVVGESSANLGYSFGYILGL